MEPEPVGDPHQAQPPGMRHLRAASVSQAPLPDLFPVARQGARDPQRRQGAQRDEGKAGAQPHPPSWPPGQAHRQHQQTFHVEEEAHGGSGPGGHRQPHQQTHNRRQVGHQHGQVWGQGDQSRREVEGQIEGEQGGGHQALPFAPYSPRHLVGEQATHKQVAGAGEHQWNAGARPEGRVEERCQWGLVKPEVTVEDTALQDLDGPGQVIVLVRPKDSNMAQAGEHQPRQNPGPSRPMFHPCASLAY